MKTTDENLKELLQDRFGERKGKIYLHRLLFMDGFGGDGIKGRWSDGMERVALLDALAVAFCLFATWAEEYARDAKAFADGGHSRKLLQFLGDDGWMILVARRAKAFAKRHPAQTQDAENPFEELPGAIVSMRAIAEGRTKPENAVRLAMDCARWGELASEQIDAFMGREKLKKAMGTKRQRRKERRETKADREGVRLLDVVRLFGAGWTGKQVAEKLGISVRTVEELARIGRERGILAKRTPGRKKTVREGDTIGGGGGEREMDGEAVRAYVDKQQNEEDGDGME